MNTRCRVTPLEVRALFMYEKETGCLFWKARRRDSFASVGSWKCWNTKYSDSKAGYTVLSGTTAYRVIRIGGHLHLAHRLCWMHCTGIIPPSVIDHINGNGLDNRIENLREATMTDNQKNAPRRIDNKSGVTGVAQDKYSGNWRAYIRSDGERIGLGTFSTLAEAAQARKDAEIIHGFHKNHGREQGVRHEY